MGFRLAVILMLLAACGSASTGGSSCSDGGTCPCAIGGDCRPMLTCTAELDWKILECTCSSTNKFTCTSRPKPNGPCEATQYCNRGVPSCQAETATCNRDCRCEYTTTANQGVWLCQENCGAAKECPKVRPMSTACTLDPAVRCGYWNATDNDSSCRCNADGGGLWACTD